MELEQAVRSRRTHKAYGTEPVAREVLEELFELATWAPNHHLTNPWRFRVLGPASLERLRGVAERGRSLVGRLGGELGGLLGHGTSSRRCHH